MQGYNCGSAILTKQDLVGAVHDEDDAALLAAHNQLAACACAGRVGLVDDVGRDLAGGVDELVQDQVAVLRKQWSPRQGPQDALPSLKVMVEPPWG